MNEYLQLFVRVTEHECKCQGECGSDVCLVSILFLGNIPVCAKMISSWVMKVCVIVSLSVSVYMAVYVSHSEFH